ncbi:MAG: hypothetical protein ACKOUR_10705, partial [Planctomycetota bacterium]
MGSAQLAPRWAATVAPGDTEKLPGEEPLADEFGEPEAPALPVEEPLALVLVLPLVEEAELY